MKSIVFLTLVILLTACSDNSDKATNQNDSTSTQTIPNKFKMAAITKVRASNPGLSAEKATCVVEQMTADGTIGLGEINQMKLTEGNLDNNASNLTAAYKKAMQQCQ